MASRGINKVILVGNLGNDPEHRMLPSGGAVTNISIATSEAWKDKNTGQQQERTEWHRVVFFNRLAEIAAEYLRKGSKVYVEGSLRTRKWQDQQSGQDRYSTEIVASEMQMLDSRGGDGGSGGGGQSQGNYGGASGGGFSQAPAEPQGGFGQTGGTIDPMDDDIPFNDDNGWEATEYCAFCCWDRIRRLAIHFGHSSRH